MPNGRSHICGFLKHLHVQNGRGHLVKPLKPIFYKCYVDDTYVKRKHNEAGTLFDELSLYNPNIKFTLE